MTTNFKQLAEQYKHELLDKVVPFWLDKSQDTQHGGYFTCLERDGSVFDTDKFVWLQGREVWMFATLYNKVEKRQEWLDCAIQGAEFLKKHGHDGHLNWYFALDREGHPLVEPYNIFSYTFAVIAFGQLSLATGNKEYADIAKRTFDIVLSKVDNPKGKWNKAAPGARALKSFALPMILCNVALEIEPLLDPDFMRRTIDTCIHEVMDVFYRPELGLIVEIALNEAEYGWDKQYGGIFYFMDRLGRPCQQLEWDQKLWWVHIETLITMLKGYQLTGNAKCLEWFERVHEYVWSHFADPEHPEWFGYLNRRGEVLLPLKGGKWKGCFHVPRGLFQCWQILEDLASRA